jgi:hypothetical protein
MSWIHRALTGLALLGCIAVVALWIRSYWFEDWIMYRGARDYEFYSVRGLLRARVSFENQPPLNQWRGGCRGVVPRSRCLYPNSEFWYPKRAFFWHWNPHPTQAPSIYYQIGIENAYCAAIGVPHWALATFMGLPWE